MLKKSCSRVNDDKEYFGINLASLSRKGKERSFLHIVYVEKDKEEHENVNRKSMAFKALKYYLARRKRKRNEYYSIESS